MSEEKCPIEVYLDDHNDTCFRPKVDQWLFEPGSGGLEEFHNDLVSDYRGRTMNMQGGPRMRIYSAQQVLWEWWGDGRIKLKPKQVDDPRVISLPTPQKLVYESVTKTIQHALDLGNEGDLTDVVIVGTMSDGGMFIHSSEANDRFKRLGHLTFALVTLVTEIHKRDQGEEA